MAAPPLRRVAPVVRPRRGAYVGATLAGESLSVVQVCGRLVIELDGRRRESLLPGRQGRIVFAYLVVNRARDVTGEQLAEAVWGDDATPVAESTLRALLSKVRRAVGADALSRGGPYRLQLPAGTRVDIEAAFDAIHRAESAVGAQEWRRAWGPSLVALITAERGFLPGEDAPWVEEQRRTLAELELRALECYANATLGIGGRELFGAERAARKLVAREPYRESGHRLLMRSLAEQGNVAEAMRAYDALASRLREDLGVAPSPATRELHRELLAIT